MRSVGSLPTRNTPSRTGDDVSEEQKQRTILFFSRLKLIYGKRFLVQWPDAETLRKARREWAGQVSRYSWAELERALEITKQALVDGDPDFYWPDIGRILGVARARTRAAHRVFQRALPEGEGVKRARLEAGRQGMAQIRQLMGGGHAG